MVYLALLLVIAWIAAGVQVTLLARAHYRDPERLGWGTDIFRGDLFTPRGERYRRIALGVYLAGPLIYLGMAVLAGHF